MRILPMVIAATLGTTFLVGPAMADSPSTSDRDPQAVAAEVTDGTTNVPVPRSATSISGTVTDYDGETVDDTLVCPVTTDGMLIENLCEFSDADGDYEVSVPAGKYYLLFVPTYIDLAYEFYEDAVTLDTATLVPSGSTGIDAQLDPQATISGQILNGHKGDEICAVDAQGPVDCQELENRNEDYVLFVDPGTYDVAYYRWGKAVEYRNDKADPTYDLRIERSQDMDGGEFDLDTVITGKVDGPAGARVTVYDSSSENAYSSTTTNSDGRYHIVVPPGSYVLAFSTLRVPASYNGGVAWRSEAQPIAVADYRTTTVDGLVGGHLTPALIDAPDGTKTRLLDANGRVLREGAHTYVARPGTYRIEAYLPQSLAESQKYVYGVASATVQHGETASTVRMTLPRIGYAKPAAVVPTAEVVGADLRISWDQAPVDKYKVSVGGVTTSTTSPWIVANHLRGGKTYTALITAINGDQQTVSTTQITVPKVQSTSSKWKVRKKKRVYIASIDFTNANPRAGQLQRKPSGTKKWSTVRNLRVADNHKELVLSRSKKRTEYRVVMPAQGMFTRHTTPVLVVAMAA